MCFFLVDRLPITMLFLNWLLIQVVYNVVRFSLDAVNSIKLLYFILSEKNDYIFPHFPSICFTGISLGSNSITHSYCCLQVFLVDAKGNSFYREGKIIGFDPAYDLAVLKVYIPILSFFSPSFYSFSEHMVLCYFLASAQCSLSKHFHFPIHYHHVSSSAT